MLERFTRQLSRQSLAAGAVLVLSVAVSTVLWLRSDRAAHETSPDGTPSNLPAASVSADSLSLPEGCLLFDRGFWLTPVEDGMAVTMRLSAASCATPALDALAEDGRGIEVTWTVAGVGATAPSVRAVLVRSYDEEGRPAWGATVTFPEPGRWMADGQLGGAASVQVTARSTGLVRHSEMLPLPSAPQTITVLDGAATRVVRTFPSERGGFGILSDPSRVVFMQTRDGGRWLVTGDVANGAVTPLFEVGPFANVVSAPDGRAIAVEWGNAGGPRQLRVVQPSGQVTSIDDGTINTMTLAWSPDSQVLLVDGDSRWVLGPDGSVRDRQPSPDLGAAQMVWAPDSSYALLRYGQPGRLVRLDRASLAEQAIGDAVAAIDGVAVSSDGKMALGWRDLGTKESHLSVLTGEEIRAGAQIDDRIAATFSDAETAPDASTLSWSPDGRLISFVRRTIFSEGPPRGSEIIVLDPATGTARQFAATRDSYAGYTRRQSWSADGSLIFALRYNCHSCEPSRSSVDVIDIAAGRITESFEGSGLFGANEDGTALLLSAPDGVLRTDGRGHQEILVQTAGGIFFGWPIARLPSSTARPEGLLALPVGLGMGEQMFAARPDGSGLELLATLRIDEAYVLLDRSTVIARGDRRWERRALSGGAAVPYGPETGAVEKWDLVLSPSKRLALDLDREGFAIFDVAEPSLPPVVPRRAYPAGGGWQPQWSADDRRVAFADERTIGVFDLDGGRERVFEVATLTGRARDDAGSRQWGMTWTPDGRLEFATPGGLWRLDVDAGTAVRVSDAPRPGGFTDQVVLAYAPDGRTLAAATPYGLFARVEDGGWRQLSGVGVARAPRPELYWAPDGSSIVYLGSSAFRPEGVIVAPLDGSGAYRLVAPGGGRVLGWLPDGRVVWVSVVGGV